MGLFTTTLQYQNCSNRWVSCWNTVKNNYKSLANLKPHKMSTSKENGHITTICI